MKRGEREWLPWPLLCLSLSAPHSPCLPHALPDKTTNTNISSHQQKTVILSILGERNQYMWLRRRRWRRAATCSPVHGGGRDLGDFCRYLRLVSQPPRPGPPHYGVLTSKQAAGFFFSSLSLRSLVCVCCARSNRPKPWTQVDIRSRAGLGRVYRHYGNVRCVRTPCWRPWLWRDHPDVDSTI